MRRAMTLTLPTILTLLRIALVPVLVAVFYLPWSGANIACVVIFSAAGFTDWLDGYVARKTGQFSTFGAFLDPVADKLMVAVALIILVQYQATAWFALAAAVIVGREIAVSALREWMAELGQRAQVKVSWIGKSKTTLQMIAIGMLLYREPMGPLPVPMLGEWLLYVAAALTLWSMVSYLRAAWPYMKA